MFEGSLFESGSIEDTQDFAAKMAAQAKPGDIICLCGEMGAGKTAFAQGFAQGLGVKGHVNSPTFTIMQIYEDGRLPMYHFDLYRLEDSALDDLCNLGFDEYFLFFG